MSSLILPKKLYDAISSLNLSKTHTNHCYQFINLIFYLNNYNKDILTINPYLDIPRGVIRNKISYDYTKYLSPLIINGIIKRSFYSNHKDQSHFRGKKLLKGKAFGYKINDDLFDFSDFLYIEWNKNQNKHKNMQLETVIDDLNLLEIDVKGMMEAIKNYDIEDYIEVNEDITDDEVEIVDLLINQNGKPIPYKLNTGIALDRARRRGVDLIKYKDYCYYAPLERFKQIKLNNFRASQVYAVTMLLNNDFYASINDTNNRLDTNLTNLKSSFLKDGYIKLEGESLTDIDMKNSQPTLLAYLLSDINAVLSRFPSLTEKYKFPSIDNTATDTVDFIKKAGSGLVYDYICERTGWERSFAKIIFLRTMFSKAGWNSGHKKTLKELFPTVISWMDEFKSINGHKELAILLQKIESEIFIRNIYPAIRNAGYIVFTKHDSLVCRVSQKQEIKKKMEEILDQYGFRYRLE